MVSVTVSEIRTEMLNSVNDEYDKTEGYLIYDLLNAAAIELEKSNTAIKSVESLLDVENLTGELLEKFVKQRKGIERTPATKSTGTVTVTGSGTISVGDLFETKSGIQFEASEKRRISGTGSVRVACLVAGSVGNVPANQIIQMPVTLGGITSVTNEQPTTGGYEIESEESLRERYFVAVRTPPTSGNVYHYLQWAKEVSGVGDAKVFPVERGNNTVEIVIIDQQKKPADGGLVKSVQSYIDPDSKGLGVGQAPIGAKCYVVAAQGLELTINVTVTKTSGIDDETAKKNIEASITKYLQDIAFKTNYVSYAKIGEAIINADGVEDYKGLTVNGKTDNIAVGSKQVAILGGVTIV